MSRPRGPAAARPRGGVPPARRRLIRTPRPARRAPPPRHAPYAPIPAPKAIPAYRSLDACCTELVKMLSWQNQAACVAKSAEVFKVQGGGGGGGGARFIQKKDADIEARAA
jgi:hypothetical protein